MLYTAHFGLNTTFKRPIIIKFRWKIKNLTCTQCLLIFLSIFIYWYLNSKWKFEICIELTRSIRSETNMENVQSKFFAFEYALTGHYASRAGQRTRHRLDEWWQDMNKKGHTLLATWNKTPLNSWQRSQGRGRGVSFRGMKICATGIPCDSSWGQHLLRFMWYSIVCIRVRVYS